MLIALLTERRVRRCARSLSAFSESECAKPMIGVVRQERDMGVGGQVRSHEFDARPGSARNRVGNDRRLRPRRQPPRMLGASGTFFQCDRLSAMILVDCIADWLNVAYCTISRC